jgi:acetyltransferase-like isoleucine patch superfamily enzyme
MIKRLIKGALRRLLRLTRRLKYQALSTNTWTGHAPKRYQPLLLAGLGTISFQTNVRIGLSSSPKFWSSECYIEARSTSAKVEIGQNTWINNGFSAISNGGSISIGQDCHIGHDVFIIDSDFHLLDPNKRNVDPGSQPVCIGNNVFIGSQVTILKNTHIGDGSVVAASAVVSGTFTARSLIAGNPARLIRTL